MRKLFTLLATLAPILLIAAAPAQAQTTALYFIEVDHLNTPRLIADANQNVVWRWNNQEPFGDTPPDENPSGLGTFEFPKRFDGQYADKDCQKDNGC